jgi:chromosome segregation ATPase
MLFKKLSAEQRKQLEKEREDILALISQLEEEFNKANIAENVYKEMKEKYEKKLSEINKKLGIKEEKKEEKKKEEGVYEKTEEGPVFIDPLNPPKEIEEVKVEESKEEIAGGKIGVELEKMKAFIESLRETDKTLNEQIRSLAEALGEVRSMAFQTDGALKELEMKVDKLASDIEELRPEKIEKEN